MKHLFSWILCSVLLMSFYSCHKTDTPSKEEEKPIQQVNDTLVVYFSCTNNTKAIASFISEIKKADVFQIQPAVPYTAEDLAYYTDCRADREQKDPSARPAISNKIDSLSKYRVIYLGYPIWHGQAPKIIYTLLESNDFSGKTIIPFCTSASSPIGSSDTNLHSLAPKAVWGSGKRFAIGSSREEVKNWL